MKGGSSQQHPQNQNTYTKNKTIFTLFLSGADDVITSARKLIVLLVLMSLEIYYLQPNLIRFLLHTWPHKTTPQKSSLTYKLFLVVWQT